VNPVGCTPESIRDWSRLVPGNVVNLREPKAGGACGSQVRLAVVAALSRRCRSQVQLGNEGPVRGGARKISDRERVLPARWSFCRAAPTSRSGVHLDLALRLAAPGIPAPDSLFLPCSPTRKTAALGDRAAGIFQPLLFRFRCHRERSHPEKPTVFKNGESEMATNDSHETDHRIRRVI
jgi:hypothetical protein